MLRLLDVLLEKYAPHSCIYFSWDAVLRPFKKLYKRVDEINSVKYRAPIIAHQSDWLRCLHPHNF